MDLAMNVSGSLRYCPGTQGGSEWNGPAYAPALNLIVVGAVDWCTSLRLTRRDSSIQTKPGTPWTGATGQGFGVQDTCLLYTSPSPRDRQKSRMPSSA